MSIPLHPTLGVNPHLTFCPRCGGEVPVLLLLGAMNTKFECHDCKAVSIGARHCLKCDGQRNPNRHGRKGRIVKIEENEKLPGSLCDDCVKRAAEWRGLVEAGGLYARCTDCGMEGVISPSEATASVREKHNCPAPELLGIGYSKADCPECSDEAVAHKQAKTPEPP